MHHRLLAATLLVAALCAGCAGRSRVPLPEDADAWAYEPGLLPQATARAD